MDYYCLQWPFYDLGKGIKFEDGRFSTDDPGQIEIIEANDKFKVFIWPGSPPVAVEEVEANDKASEGGIPTPQHIDGEASGACEEIREGSVQQGREEGSVFQELEELVRGSGIIGGKDQKPVTIKGRKRAA
jgi:hypothetical protein